MRLPITQGELIRSARGDLSQAVFARQLGVDRSCLSRYESEGLGAPPSVINACLRMAAERATDGSIEPADVALDHALASARSLVNELEQAVARHRVSRATERGDE